MTFDETLSSGGTYAATFDDSRTIRDFGWKPEYDLDKAITDHISSVQNSNDSLKKNTPDRPLN